MSRRLLPLVLAAAALAVGAGSATAGRGAFQVTAVGRLPFPQRAYVIDLARGQAIASASVAVTENDEAVHDLTLAPLDESGMRFGTVLAIDASRSMAGPPFASALEAARSFVARRGRHQSIGLVAFNGSVRVLQRPTASAADLGQALAGPPALSYGTRIYDALDRSLSLLGQANVGAASVVLMSDGADVGSSNVLEQVVARARREHVRIFTVGLRSGAFEAAPLQALAAQTGGSYTEAASAADLEPIYRSLGRRLANEYLLQYRSAARPKTHVAVRIAVGGVGEAAVAYEAPSGSALAPFHRSLASRFFLSSGSLVVLALLVAGVVSLWLRFLLRRRQAGLVDRVNEFVYGRSASRPARLRARVRKTLGESRRTRGWLADLERDLEIADIQISGSSLALLTIAATAIACLILAMVSPVLAVLGLLLPLGPRGFVKRRLKQVREEFSEQLPANLQVLASALRAGHGLTGALTVVVANAHDPSRRELRRVIADEQLGALPEEAIRRVGVRMANRDLEQVALLAELQRTAGGNAAEVLDTVVETIRERADVRRLAKTLTAQGRMARWILTALPVFVAGFMWLIQPGVMRLMFDSTGGQVALVVAGLMIVAGSLTIQRIVDIKV